MPILVSKSIKHLSIRHINWHLNRFVQLFGCTPNTHHLCARLTGDDDDKQLESSIQSISTLNLFVSSSTSGMFNLLQNMPNLYRLIIKTAHVISNGYQWKQIIADHLPKLKVFKFYIIYQLTDCDEKEEAITCLLDWYHTSYWPMDRQWFVRYQ